MKMILLFLVAFTPIFGQCDGRIRTVTGNWEVNLHGVQDHRPYTWGKAEHSVKTLTFSPPENCLVEVLKVRGDLVAWPMFTDGVVERAVDTKRPLNKVAGTLLSIAKTGPEGSKWCDLAEDKTFIYLQLPVHKRPERATFSEDIPNGLLNPDHKLDFKLAVWLNATGVPIHLEATWTVHYKFVEVEDGRRDEGPETRILGR